jgi:hypothetical protein
MEMGFEREVKDLAPCVPFVEEFAAEEMAGGVAFESGGAGGGGGGGGVGHGVGGGGKELRVRGEEVRGEK